MKQRTANLKQKAEHRGCHHVPQNARQDTPGAGCCDLQLALVFIRHSWDPGPP